MGVREALPLLGAEASLEDLRCSDRWRSRKREDGTLRGASLAIDQHQRQTPEVLEQEATRQALLSGQKRGIPLTGSVRKIFGRSASTGQLRWDSQVSDNETFR